MNERVFEAWVKQSEGKKCFMLECSMHACDTFSLFINFKAVATAVCDGKRTGEVTLPLHEWSFALSVGLSLSVP